MDFRGKRILITGGSGFIGINLINSFISSGNYQILNLDLKAPLNQSQVSLWRYCDILNYDALNLAFKEFIPDVIIHLAARTDISGSRLEDYSVNTIGVANVVKAINNSPSVDKVIFASSMLVCSVGYQPKDVLDYDPPNAYGASKVRGEMIVRTQMQKNIWTIVRPTSIWGPWFDAPYKTFFNFIKTGKYFHISGNEKILKTYGYVENTCFQILSIIAAKDKDVVGKTFYLGDYSYYIIKDWADEIAGLVGQRLMTMPIFACFLLAKIGDLLQLLHIRFPMTSFRLKNLSTENKVDLSTIKSITSDLPYDRNAATKRTLQWLIDNNIQK
jgi:GlcNAc-P-P-Und epimerase